ncbi:M13 family metallopeptidase [Qipengyuania sp. JC766]|uniref:M13 family metallopeptidase n=1 Tax=Qipengyuania sp. JC766 TaxID=3232139 RepID=UPI003458FDA4
MIRTLLTVSASAAALAIAAPALAHPSQDADAQDIEKLVQDDVAQAAAPQEVPTPTMSFGEWGIDPALVSDQIDPGDDFFGYVNQQWLDANPLPAEYSRFGAFNLLREKSTTDIKTLVDELMAQDGSLANEEQRIVDAYKAFLDTDAIEEANLLHAQPYLDAINNASTLEELVELWSIPGYPSPVGGYVTVDAKQPDTYTVYLGTGGLGLPDRDYYLDESEKGQEIQAKYREYLTFLFEEAGYEDPANAAQSVYGLEDWIARTIAWDRTVSRNRDLTYNAVTPQELRTLAGDFPIDTMLAATGLDASDKFVIPQIPPTAQEIEELGLDEATLQKIGTGTPGMFEFLAERPLSLLKSWTMARFLSSNAAVLPKRFDDANFAFYGQTLSGQQEQRPRWKRAIDETEGHLGEQLGKSYVARYFPPENKAAMDDLVVNLRKAMRASIDEIDWMGAETKQQALAKLDSFDPKIGYRDNLETYPGLAIADGDPLANRFAAARWQTQDNLSKLGQPIDRTEWFMLPQTVNAYYNATKNEIVFPAAILQQPFFGITADPAVNYGAIGGVIGHEMGHGFDDQGSKSDASGALRNWWTDADRAAFDELGDALVAQYNAYCPLDDGETCVNGRLTLGENIGDLGGLNLAYRAYKMATAGQDVPVIDGFTGDQRFFMAWAQVWRSKQTEASYRQRLRTDSHSPEEYRTNGVVRNLDAWYEAFNVTPEDELYLPPEERVTIW